MVYTMWGRGHLQSGPVQFLLADLFTEVATLPGVGPQLAILRYSVYADVCVCICVYAYVYIYTHVVGVLKLTGIPKKSSSSSATMCFVGSEAFPEACQIASKWLFLQFGSACCCCPCNKSLPIWVPSMRCNGSPPQQYTLGSPRIL